MTVEPLGAIFWVKELKCLMDHITENEDLIHRFQNWNSMSKSIYEKSQLEHDA